MAKLSKRKNNTNAKKTGILRVLTAPVRYIKCKIRTIYEKISKKRTKKTVNEVYNQKNLKKVNKWVKRDC